MSFSTEIRRQAGALNRSLQDAVLRARWLPAPWARAFGAVHGRLMESAYALPVAQMRVDPRHLLTRLLRPGDVMIDVGASTGLTAEIASRRVGPAGHVFAFEPQESARAELEAKRQRYGWTNVRIYGSLVGRASGDAVLYQHPSNSEISSLSPGWNRVECHGVSHPMVSLDDWARANQLERVDLIKVDVEGAEMDVIRGGRALLDEHRPTLLLEINNRARRRKLFGYGVDDLLLELRAIGYESFACLRPGGPHRFLKEAELSESDRDMLAC